jgi:uncharacterized protein (TIGR02466 family)
MPSPTPTTVQQFWATNFFAFGWPEHETEAPGIVAYLYELRAAQQSNIASGIAPGAKSPYGLYESDFDLFDRDQPGLHKLKTFVDRCVQQAVAHVNGSQLDPSRIRVEIRDSWFHITNSGGFHDAHCHGGCSWCGIYYLQIGDSGQRTNSGAPNGGNRFYSPLAGGGRHQDYGNSYLNLSYVDPPMSDGMLLLFPSFLMHSGLAYQGEKDRIVISFNSRSYPV